MPRRDKARWIEPADGAALEPGSGARMSRLMAAADETARRHPAAVAAAIFCGGVATGTWLARAAGRGRLAAGEAEPPSSDRPTAALATRAGDGGESPAADPREGRVARLRNPIGSPSVLQP